MTNPDELAAEIGRSFAENAETDWAARPRNAVSDALTDDTD